MDGYIIQIGEKDFLAKTYLSYFPQTGFKLTNRFVATVFLKEHIESNIRLLNYLCDKEYHIYKKDIKSYDTYLYRYRDR